MLTPGAGSNDENFVASCELQVTRYGFMARMIKDFEPATRNPEHVAIF
jgi:hypothetical protein